MLPTSFRFASAPRSRLAHTAALASMLIAAAPAARPQSDPGNFGTVINAPPAVIGDEQEIGSDTQLNVSDGGSVGFGFEAGAKDGTSNNVEVNIFGGIIGSDFNANTGSTVNLAGGTQSIGFHARPGSEVRILGGEFKLNGAPPAGSTVTLRGNDYLTGTFHDGSPFLFSPSNNYSGLIAELPSIEALSDQLDQVALIEQALPVVNTTPMVIASPADAAPSGLRADQTLTLESDGQLGPNFTAVDAALHIKGGHVGMGLEVADSELRISDGFIQPGFGVYGDTTAEITGGRFGLIPDPEEDGSFSVGIFGTAVNAGSTLNISGGRFFAGLVANPGGTLNISGGRIGGFFYDSITAYAGSTVNLVGTEFFLDGTPISELDLNETFLLEDRAGVLTGRLAEEFSSEMFSLDLGETSPLFSSGGYVHPDAILTLTLVPEPGVAVLLGVAALNVSSRRSNRPWTL